jgi:cyclin-A
MVYVDIDADLSEPMSCSEYAEEIFCNLRQSETLRRPLTTYMESVQTDVNSAMRAILVDWLVEVGQEYRLASDTLFLSVAYIDRYLSLVDVKRNKLQLVGVTSMLVASKYEEIYAPQVDEFCYITDNTYPREQVISQEKEVLAALDFDLTQPTTKTFLRRYIKAAAGEIDVNVTFEFLCSYLAELTLMEYSLLSYLPSHVAASCILVGLCYLGKPRWSHTLLRYSGYTPAELKHCAQALHGLFLGARTSALPASRDKYANAKFGQVSLLGVPDSLPESLFQSWQV